MLNYCMESALSCWSAKYQLIFESIDHIICVSFSPSLSSSSSSLLTPIPSHPMAFVSHNPSPPNKSSGHLLHNNTTTASTTLLTTLAYIHLCLWSISTSVGAAGSVASHLFVISTDLADDIVEGIVNIDARFCRSFDEFAAKAAG